MAASRRSRPNFPHAILLEDDDETDQPNTKHDDAQASGPSPPQGYPTSYSPQLAYGGVSQSPPGSHGSTPRPPSQPEPISFIPPGPSSPSNSSSGSFAQYAAREYAAHEYAAHESGGVPTSYTYMTPAGVIHGQGVLVHPPVNIQCHLCGLSFTRQHDLRRHHKSKHEDDKSDCTCGKSFSRKDALLRHQRADPLTGYCGCEVYQLKASLARNQ